MGIFSKTPRSPETGQAAMSETQKSTTAPEETRAEETPSNVQHLSPFAIKMQEKMHALDGLKTRLGGLSQAFDQMSALASENRNSIMLMSEFVEASRVHVETEIRLKSENAKISTDLLDANHKVGSLSTQLEEAQAEVHSLRKRLTETRTALETARNELISIRDNNKKVNEEYRAQSAELVEANSQISELSGSLVDFKAKYKTLENLAESLQSNLDDITKREKELQQNLSESAALLEEEVRKNNAATSELEAVKRQVVDFRNDNIDLKSHLDVANQELAYSKTRLEDEQRKHDNEVYALNAEIENLSSQRRIGAQSMQELTRENAQIKERNRDLIKRMQEIEHLLDGAQKNHEKDRDDLLSTNAKLRELNLRYNSALTDLNHERNQNKRYTEQLEELVEENKTLQRFKIQVGTANEQIVQLKGVIANYQRAMEGRGPAEMLGLTDNYGPAEELGLTETGHADDQEDDDEDDNKIVKLRDDSKD